MADDILAIAYRFGFLDDPIDDRRRDDQDPVDVAEDEIPRRHGDTADADGHVKVRDVVTVDGGQRRMVAAENRKIDVQYLGRIAHAPRDDNAGGALAPRRVAHQLAPVGGGGFVARIDDDDAAGDDGVQHVHLPVAGILAVVVLAGAAPHRVDGTRHLHLRRQGTDVEGQALVAVLGSHLVHDVGHRARIELA